VAGLRKILLVEDNVELRNLYELFLKAHEFEVATASDGEEGVKVAETFRPDLIFLDIMMPKMDGFQVLHELRHNPSHGCASTRIVILTNLGDPSKVTPEVERDMDGYVVKAEIQLADLIEIIKSLEVPPTHVPKPDPKAAT
jgi:DNA-binding response OmpR family regulator